MSSSGFKLASYFKRVALHEMCSAAPPATLATLTAVMDAQSRNVPFENVDVVLGKIISIDPGDVARKLVDEKRGGYCWEQNTLLQSALEAIGFAVKPLNCRVRWGKTEATTFTHMCLQVDVEGEPYLADVGFAGTNSIQPVSLSADSPQELSDGTFRTSEHEGYVCLEKQDRKDLSSWLPLYCWANSGCNYPDLVCGNWFSCTFQGARFTSQFFASIVHEDEKHYILNDVFVRRKIGGDTVETVQIGSIPQLVGLLKGHFALEIQEEDGLGKYLRHDARD
jgi:N-hydroxyarylamine O-acetyltransferase